MSLAVSRLATSVGMMMVVVTMMELGLSEAKGNRASGVVRHPQNFYCLPQLKKELA